MKRDDCTVLVVSCDAYSDVVPPFIALWRKFWPDCPFETVLLTETVPCDGFDRVLAVGKCNDWAPRILRGLDQIATPYVLLVLNDYLLRERVDTALVCRRLDEAKRFDALNLRLRPNPPGRTPWKNTDLLEMPKNAAYCISCQTGFWNRDFFAGLLAKMRSAWEFERQGSFSFDGTETRPLLVTPASEFPFVDALHKGCWAKAGLEVCELAGIEPDFSVHARTSPFRVRVREGLKRFVFAVVPWTWIVRLQNAIAGKRNR